jgi:hypothetical protein
MEGSKMKRMRSFLVWLFAAALTLGVLPSQKIASARAEIGSYAQEKNIQELFSSAARGTSNGSGVETNEANSLIAYLNVTAKSAGATSLDVQIQDSVDNSIWTDLTGCTFSQVTGSTSSQSCVASRVPARWVRAVATVAGSSTPTFTFSVRVMLFKSDQLVTATTALDASLLSTGTVPTPRLSEDVARTASVTVTTAQVLALNTTPIALVAAPGAGKIVLIEEITCKLVFNSIAYTGSNALEFRYTDGSGAKVTADMPSAFLNSASGTNYQTVKSVVTTLTPVANAAVVVFVPTANPGAGNSDLAFKIKYRVVTP